MFASPATDWSQYDMPPTARPEIAVGRDFFQTNGPGSYWFLTLARWACIPFCVMGGYVCFRWATDLYGPASGLAALVLWCFSPYVLGHGALITPDAHAAAMAVAAGYTFWLWLRRPGWPETFVAGIVLGLAELTKFTLLIFYPVWLVVGITSCFGHDGDGVFRTGLHRLGKLGAMIVLSVVVINFGYCFEGSFGRLGDCRFYSHILKGSKPTDYAYSPGNRFTDSWLGTLPVPLPDNFVRGIDMQKWDFEKSRRSYLHGEWKSGGWWYYYLYALAVKLPVGTLLLGALAIVATLFKGGYCAKSQDELVLLMPFVAIFVLVSSETSFSIHSRYVLPALPFVFIWMSKVGRSVSLQHRTVMLLGGVALVWSASSSLWVYPHDLSYFNLIAGGPENGHAHLLGSDMGWGQDLLYLKDWLDRHPKARPFHLAAYGVDTEYIHPRLAGIEFTEVPAGPSTRRYSTRIPKEDLGPRPGWYAVDVNYLLGASHPRPDLRGSCDYQYFLRFQPVALAGYSIYIYHITLDEANRVRRELGMAEVRE
jgi:hypothetical protein